MFCLDLLEPWQVYPEEQLLFCPEEQTQKVEGSSRSFHPVAGVRGKTLSTAGVNRMNEDDGHRSLQRLKIEVGEA